MNNPEKRAFDLHLTSSSRFTGNNNDFRISIGDTDAIKNMSYKIVLKYFSFDNTINQNNYANIRFIYNAIIYNFSLGPATFTAYELAQNIQDAIRFQTGGILFTVGFDSFLNQFWIQRPAGGFSYNFNGPNTSANFLTETGLTNNTLLTNVNTDVKIYFGSNIDLRPIKDVFVKLTNPPTTNPNYLLLSGGNVGKDIIGKIPLIGGRYSRINYIETSDDRNSHSYISSLGSEIGIRLVDNFNNLIVYSGECFLTLHLIPEYV